MVRQRLHPEVIIRSSSPYPHSSGVYSIGGGYMESCARRISSDPVGFRVHSCGFRLVPSDLQFSFFRFTGCHLWRRLVLGPLEP
jgi:hypothetical protein